MCKYFFIKTRFLDTRYDQWKNTNLFHISVQNIHARTRTKKSDHRFLNISLRSDKDSARMEQI